MLTTEFKQRLVGLGYTWKELNTGSNGRITQIAIYDSNILIGKVSTAIQYRMSTMNNKIGKRHGKLFGLMVDYVQAPIKERI